MHHKKNKRKAFHSKDLSYVTREVSIRNRFKIETVHGKGKPEKRSFDFKDFMKERKDLPNFKESKECAKGTIESLKRFLLKAKKLNPQVAIKNPKINLSYFQDFSLLNSLEVEVNFPDGKQGNLILTNLPVGLGDTGTTYINQRIVKYGLERKYSKTKKPGYSSRIFLKQERKKGNSFQTPEYFLLKGWNLPPN